MRMSATRRSDQRLPVRASSARSYTAAAASIAAKGQLFICVPYNIRKRFALFRACEPLLTTPMHIFTDSTQGTRNACR